MLAPQENASVRTKDLNTAADQAIAVCGGDAREAVKALIAANDFLESQVEEAAGSRVDGIFARQIRRAS